MMAKFAACSGANSMPQNPPLDSSRSMTIRRHAKSHIVRIKGEQYGFDLVPGCPRTSTLYSRSAERSTMEKIRFFEQVGIPPYPPYLGPIRSFGANFFFRDAWSDGPPMDFFTCT